MKTLLIAVTIAASIAGINFAALPEQTPAEEPEIVQIDTAEAELIAKCVWGEARGCSTTEQAAVMWCILNRVDAGYGTVTEVITAPYQFTGYRSGNPVDEEIYNLAVDVLTRWERGKTGQTDVGRVLPSDYLWFNGSGGHNWFRNEYKGGTYWDWSLDSPYED